MMTTKDKTPSTNAHQGKAPTRSDKLRLAPYAGPDAFWMRTQSVTTLMK